MAAGGRGCDAPRRVEIIPPAIDPLSPKNLAPPVELARTVLAWIGIDLTRPLATQVSRFDPWKDPLGVIRAYRVARQRHPELQLALVGSMALDDPRGWSIYEEIEREIEGDPLVHAFTNMSGVGNIEVNAFQQLSNVIVQKSIREGSAWWSPRRCGRGRRWSQDARAGSRPGALPPASAPPG